MTVILAEWDQLWLVVTLIVFGVCQCKGTKVVFRPGEIIHATVPVVQQSFHLGDYTLECW